MKMEGVGGFQLDIECIGTIALDAHQESRSDQTDDDANTKKYCQASKAQISLGQEVRPECCYSHLRIQ
jgi:hypothetical protein